MSDFGGDGQDGESAGGQLPHHFYGNCLRQFSDFKQRGFGASIIAGAYSRTADVASSSLSCDTASRCVTLQTPSIFIDLRLQPSREVLAKKCAKDFEGLSCEELVRLGSTEQVGAAMKKLTFENCHFCFAALLRGFHAG